MANGKFSRELNGKCSCAEGYIGIYDEEGKYLRSEPTHLYAHDCEYIKERNSKIRAAERLAEMRGITFLQAMDHLMNPGIVFVG